MVPAIVTVVTRAAARVVRGSSRIRSMRILALDTSTEWCSVAVGDGTHWHRLDEHAGQAHSERVLPMVHAALGDASWPLASLDGIAFGSGPGSFTGIRIGCGVAQGLALGADLPLAPIATLAALAQEVFRVRDWRRVVACLDARMREVYLAVYARADDQWQEITGPSVEPPSEARRAVNAGDADWYGAGNGFEAYPTLATQLRLTHAAPDARPSAQSIGELALPRLAAGCGVAAADAVPLYVRHRVALTAAEQAAGTRL